MGKTKDKAGKPAKAPKPLRVPLFDAEGARQHLAEHHGITTTDQQPPQLLASIHQADHLAAGIGGRPLVVLHYHTADVKREANE